MAVPTHGCTRATRASNGFTCDAHAVPEVGYLDLDGDGIPDAVEIRETRVLQCAPDGREEVVQVSVELAAGIGDDGIPAKIETTETQEILTGTCSGDATAVVAGAHA